MDISCLWLSSASRHLFFKKRKIKYWLQIGEGWTPTWKWEAVNELLFWLCLHAWRLLYLLNCLHLNARVFSLFLFPLFPPSHWRQGISTCVLLLLPCGVKSWQHPKHCHSAYVLLKIMCFVIYSIAFFNGWAHFDFSYIGYGIDLAED